MNIVAPHRGKQTATLDFNAAPDTIFALMCPVREAEWVPGWAPTLVVTASGLIEPDCLFVTPTEGPDAVWITARHDPKARVVTLYKVVPDLAVTRLDIAVTGETGASKATISYEHTVLGEAGRALVDAHTEESYGRTMADWKRLIDGWLAGERAA